MLRHHLTQGEQHSLTIGTGSPRSRAYYDCQRAKSDSVWGYTSRLQSDVRCRWTVSPSCGAGCFVSNLQWNVRRRHSTAEELRLQFRILHPGRERLPAAPMADGRPRQWRLIPDQDHTMQFSRRLITWRRSYQEGTEPREKSKDQVRSCLRSFCSLASVERSMLSRLEEQHTCT